MDARFKCSVCNGDLIRTQKSNKIEIIYTCVKCKRQTTQFENIKIIDMDNDNKQVLYE